jgi:hypothetical protein
MAIPCRKFVVILALISSAVWLVCSGAGAAAEVQAASTDLEQAYYDFAVADYCGFIDRPVAIGHFLLVHDIMARGNISPDENRAARLAAITAVDLEYFDRGLSGQKTWCRTEGATAAARFTTYFQRRGLP